MMLVKVFKSNESGGFKVIFNIAIQKLQMLESLFQYWKGEQRW